MVSFLKYIFKTIILIQITQQIKHNIKQQSTFKSKLTVVVCGGKLANVKLFYVLLGRHLVPNCEGRIQEFRRGRPTSIQKTNSINEERRRSQSENFTDASLLRDDDLSSAKLKFLTDPVMPRTEVEKKILFSSQSNV